MGLKVEITGPAKKLKEIIELAKKHGIKVEIIKRRDVKPKKSRKVPTGPRPGPSAT
jgi:hypothetical protein